MKHELKRKPDVQKTTMLAIVVNAVQIGVLFAFVLYVLTAGPEARNSWSLQFMVIAGALMAACVKELEVIAWPDLGCEAVRRLVVEDMPLTVVLDAAGGDLYESGPAAYLAAR